MSYLAKPGSTAFARLTPWMLAIATAASLYHLGAGILPAVVVGFFVFVWTLNLERHARRVDAARHPLSPDALLEVGLGPLPTEAASGDLYLDVVKRALINVLYCESSGPLYGGSSSDGVEMLYGVNLALRVQGQELASNTMTMIGLKRLDNIQFCIERILEQAIPGDFIEAGSLKGGACIYMKAVLRVHETTPRRASQDRQPRRIFVCDTFSPQRPDRHIIGWLVSQPVLFLIGLLTRIPFRGWQRFFANSIWRLQKSFPSSNAPSDFAVDLTNLTVRHMWEWRQPGGTSVTGRGEDNVRSHFARFGLLDDRVILLRGFFADTLPAAPIENLALLRIDGDTYESTMDALRPLYPKLSPGGFVIIDDYHEWEECRRAVDAYREEHGITDPIQRIDAAIYWCKGEAPR